MRMLMHVFFPVREFNEAVRDGTVGEKLHRTSRLWPTPGS
jgi:hypothetical protein